MRWILLALAPLAAQAAVDFGTDIQPVLESQCLSCHGPGKGFGGLRVHTRELALKGGTSGPAIVPGHPEKSPLYLRLEIPSSKTGAMPPGGTPLPKEQRDAIREWIAAGAQWPENLTIGFYKGPKLKDDLALVQKLRERIVAESGENSTELKPYTKPIGDTGISMEMVPIPGGEFPMGTPPGETGHRDDESPVHRVRLDPFWMGKYEVTWDQYRLFMFAEQAGETGNPDEVVDAVSRPTRPYVEMSFGMGINGFPAISMTQHAANKFAEWLSARTGQFYRLPTEAEWEYACRAGTSTAYSFGNDPSALGDYAWYQANSNGQYAKVGTRKPNPWGLYDMHGNVMEWTLDQYVPDFYKRSAAQNPWARSTKPYPQVARGGSWNDAPDALRCGARVGSDPSWKMQDPQLPKSIWYHTDAQWLGLRLVRPAKLPTVEEMYRYWNSGVENEE